MKIQKLICPIIALSVIGSTMLNVYATENHSSETAGISTSQISDPETDVEFELLTPEEAETVLKDREKRLKDLDMKKGDVELFSTDYKISPYSVYKITGTGGYAYYDSESYSIVSADTSIESISIPSNLTSYLPIKSIDSEAFAGCSSLSNVSFGTGVTSIGDYAFYETALTDVTITKYINVIGAGAFSYCYELSRIGVDSLNTYFCSVNGVLFNKDKTKLINYPANKSNTEYTIPDGVKQVAQQSFGGAEILEKVTFPNTVEEIGEGAFRLCYGLEAVDMNNATSLKTIGRIAFTGCGLRIINLPEGLTTIDDQAFYGCCSLFRISIPQSITSIGSDILGLCGADYADSEDDGRLDVICVPYSTADRYKEYPTYTIKSYYYDEENINYDLYEKDGGWAVFVNLKSSYNGTSYTVPDNILGKEVISLVGICRLDGDLGAPVDLYLGTKNINDENDDAQGIIEARNIIVSENNPYFSSYDGVLYSKDKTELIRYPNKNEKTEFTVPNGVKTIGYESFEGCDNLKKITISEDTMTISEAAFLFSDNLTEVIIPKNVTDIGKDILYGCENFSTIYCYQGSTADNSALYPDGTNIIYIEEKATTPIYGDASGDGELTAEDAALVLEKSLNMAFVTGIEEKTPDYIKYLDVSGDGSITADDAAQILQKTLDKSFKFSSEA